jgi:anti-sigma B factor antagonist
LIALNVMQLTERTEETIPIVAITGDIDLESSPQLRDFLKPKAVQKIPRLLLDFTGVNYIDSSGLATLIEYFQSVQSFGGKLALASLSPRVKNVFEIVRLEQIFALYPDIPAALAALKS